MSSYNNVKCNFPNIDNAIGTRASKRKSTLNAMTVNARSLKKLQHYYQLRHAISELNLDLIFVTETWFPPNYKLLLLEGYKLLRSDRGFRAGGVAIIHKSEIICEIIKCNDPVERHSHKTEFLVTEIKYKMFKYIYCTCLYKPNKKKTNLNQLLKISLKQLDLTNRSLLGTLIWICSTLTTMKLLFAMSYNDDLKNSKPSEVFINTRKLIYC